MSTADDTLLDGWLTGDADADQRLALIDRLTDDPALRDRLLARARLHRLLDAYGPGLFPDCADETTAPARHGRRWPWLLAASLAAALLLTVALDRSWSARPSSAAALTITDASAGQDAHGQPLTAAQTPAPGSTLSTATGGHLELQSTVGDRLSLGGDSRIRLPDDDRPWLLEQGRVQCSITPRAPAAAPFIIESVEARTTVLGTGFRLERDDAGSRIVVDHGQVSVHDRIPLGGSGKQVTLGPGDQLFLARPGTATLPPWSAGLATTAGRAFAPAGSHVQVVGFGRHDNYRDVVMRYHPETRIRVSATIDPAAGWIGYWWRNRESGTTYFVSLGPVPPDGGRFTVETRLGAGEANGRERRAPRNGDAIEVFHVQTGLAGGVRGVVHELVIIPGE